jgi:hypothetical protein
MRGWLPGLMASLGGPAPSLPSDILRMAGPPPPE